MAGFTLREFFAILGQLGYQPPKKGGGCNKNQGFGCWSGSFSHNSSVITCGLGGMNSFHSNMLMILAIFSYPSPCCMWNILVLPSEHSGSYGTGYPPKGYQNSGSGWWIAACRRIVWKCWQMQPASGATWCDHGSWYFGEDEMIEVGPGHLSKSENYNDDDLWRFSQYVSSINAYAW